MKYVSWSYGYNAGPIHHVRKAFKIFQKYKYYQHTLLSVVDTWKYTWQSVT